MFADRKMCKNLHKLNKTGYKYDTLISICFAEYSKEKQDENNGRVQGHSSSDGVE